MNESSPRFAGLDVGSAFTKAVLTQDGDRVLAFAMFPSAGSYKEAARRGLEEVLARSGTDRSSLAGIGATGAGAHIVPFQATKVSDLSCQAAECHRVFPSARAFIDVGAQCTKAGALTPEGRLMDFVTSEKCATGSGRFLQVIARILQIRIEEIGPLSLQARSPVEFSTSCAVFTESETISRIAEGARKEDILAGVHRAMARKTSMLVKRLDLRRDVVLTGGGGEDAGLVEALGEALEMTVLVPDRPRLTAAMGAAWLAKELYDREAALPGGGTVDGSGR